MFIIYWYNDKMVQALKVIKKKFKYILRNAVKLTTYFLIIFIISMFKWTTDFITDV